uniref:Adenosine deaminase RNA specific B2 (inactive) n=1 Tax=Acanthochromis polyacanthus TaxID=80966 RepID=A0A3Q1G214_9TELE
MNLQQRMKHVERNHNPSKKRKRNHNPSKKRKRNHNPSKKRKEKKRNHNPSSSLEVKENQDDDVLRRFHPSAFCTSFSLKRKLVDGKDRLLSQSQPAGKRSSWAVTQKNAVVQLNELRPGLRYEITSRTGPLHAPVFSVGVEVNGLHFEGRGPTKKKAKLRAAELALQSFIQFPNASQAQASMESFTSTDSLDFTADSLDFTADKLDFTVFSSTTPKRRAVSASFFQPLSPVVLLGRLRPGLRYMCLTERLHGRPARSFVMVLRLEGRVFEGCGHSKRLAKAQAAAAALQDLYSISLGPERKLPGLQDSSTKNQLPQVNSIFHLVTEKFRELTDGRFFTSSARHKVLAGIVMTRGLDLRSASVVSLATGTKCVDCGRQEDDVGWTLSDCHAETVSRRALVRFLYSQLELLMRKPADGQESSIFVPNKSCSGVFRLWDGILFHMFVSSSPCGDARLNCPYENIDVTKRHTKCRKFRFHLRKKVNGGEGTLPVSTNQRWDGLSPGKSLVSMSCTDKMAKWSVVGLQGSLLSHLVEPVYLHSLTVGTLSHTGHLSRAMRRRLATVKHLPFPYRRRPLSPPGLSSREVRPAGKPASVSLNWSCGDGGLEEVSSSTGRRTDSGTPSRLCSRSAFIRWLKLQQQASRLKHTALASCSASKMSAGRYQRAMQRFSSALQAGGLGTWLRKPPALHNFSM